MSADIARLRELLAGASAAPWQWLDSEGDLAEGDELQDGGGEMVATGFRDDLGDNFAGQGGTALTDGRLCAVARNALPALLDELDALRTRVELLDRVLMGMLRGPDGICPICMADRGMIHDPAAVCGRAVAALDHTVT
jgi:hypothetical protein